MGAPFDGGTSYRPGTRFGPRAIRTTDYLDHDGSRRRRRRARGPRRDHTIALPDVTGVARHLGTGRVSVVPFDAHADNERA